MQLIIGIAFYYYAGSQNPIVKIVQSGSYSNLDDVVILAEKTEHVSLFAYVLSSDCILIGLLWILYICKYDIFHGTFFRYLVFSIDFVYDMFYAIFPLLLIGYNNLTYITAAASVNEKSFVLLSSLVPMIYIIFKLFAIFSLLSKLAEKQFYHSFHLKAQEDNPPTVNRHKSRIEMCGSNINIINPSIDITRSISSHPYTYDHDQSRSHQLPLELQVNKKNIQHHHYHLCRMCNAN